MESHRVSWQMQFRLDLTAHASMVGRQGPGGGRGLVAAGQPVEDGQPGERRAARRRDAHRVQLGAERVDGRRGSLAVLSSSSRKLEGALGQRQRREHLRGGAESRGSDERGQVLREREGRRGGGGVEGVVVQGARGRRQVARRAEAAEAAHGERLGPRRVDVGEQALARLVRVVYEVAARPVRAEARRVEGAAQLGLVLRVPGQRAQLVTAVRELALVAVLAGAALLERPAQLGLVTARVLRHRRRRARRSRRRRRRAAGQRRPAAVHGLAVAAVQLTMGRGHAHQRTHRVHHVAGGDHAAGRRLGRRRPEHEWRRGHRGRGASQRWRHHSAARCRVSPGLQHRLRARRCEVATVLSIHHIGAVVAEE